MTTPDLPEPAPSLPEAASVACSRCNLRELRLPVGLEPCELDRIDGLVATRRKVRRGSALFRNGEPFTALYAIRTGFFKTCVAAEDGRDQVTGFSMYTCDAVALEDAEVCVMPVDRMTQLSREVPALQQHVHRIMSRETCASTA